MTTPASPVLRHEDFQIPDRVDEKLITDYILRTILPTEANRIGYAVLPKIIYQTSVRFSDTAKSLVPPLLERLVIEGYIVQAPFPNCWRRAESGPAAKA